MSKKESKLSDNNFEYIPWDYYQRHVKYNKTIEASPTNKSIQKIMNEIEIMLDGPNDSWDEEIYFKKKHELDKLIKLAESNKDLEKVA